MRHVFLIAFIPKIGGVNIAVVSAGNQQLHIGIAVKIEINQTEAVMLDLAYALQAALLLGADSFSVPRDGDLFNALARTVQGVGQSVNRFLMQNFACAGGQSSG